MLDVLVVDDLVAMRELLRLALELMGYDVAEAADGAAALAYLRATPRRTIVVLDSLLPDVDGVELLELIASDPRLAYEHTYLLMIDHQWALPDHSGAVLAALRVPLLFKPFDLNTMFESIAHLAARVRTMGMKSADSADDERGSAASTPRSLPQSHRGTRCRRAARPRSRCRRRGRESARRGPRHRAHPPT